MPLLKGCCASCHPVDSSSGDGEIQKTRQVEKQIDIEGQVETDGHATRNKDRSERNETKRNETHEEESIDVFVAQAILRAAHVFVSQPRRETLVPVVEQAVAPHPLHQHFKHR